MQTYILEGRWVKVPLPWGQSSPPHTLFLVSSTPLPLSPSQPFHLPCPLSAPPLPISLLFSLLFPPLPLFLIPHCYLLISLFLPLTPFSAPYFFPPLLFPSHLHNVPFSSVSLSLSILIVFPFHSPLPITPLPPITSLPSSSYTSLMQTYTLEGHGCTAMGVFPLLAAPTPT